MSTRSDLPWKAIGLRRSTTMPEPGTPPNEFAIIRDTIAGDDAAVIAKLPENSPCEANAGFIVRACNAHDALVAALQAFGKYVFEGDHTEEEQIALHEQWKDALALAKEEE